MLDRDPLPPAPSTATDVGDLEQLVDANQPVALVVEELSSAHLEIEDDGEDDALESIEIDDILETADLNPRMDLDLTATLQSVPTPFVPEPPKTSPVLLAQSVPSRPSRESAPLAEETANFTQPFRRPSSIAPVAMDVARPVRANTTLPIARMSARQADAVLTRLPSKINIVPWVIAASIVGLFLAGGGIVAAVATSSAPDGSPATASIQGQARPAPRTAEVIAAKTSTTEVPASATSIGAHGEKDVGPEPSDEPVSVNALPTVTPPLPTPPSRHVVAPAAPARVAPAVAPAPAPAPAPATPRPAKAASTTGVVHVPPPLAVIVVDGQHRRVVNGDVVLSCGPHKIRAGVGETHVVNVPCGGALSL